MRQDCPNLVNYVDLFYAYRASEEHNAALRTLEQGINAFPNAGVLYILRGEFLLETLGVLEAGLASCREAILRQPQSPYCHSRYANACVTAYLRFQECTGDLESKTVNDGIESALEALRLGDCESTTYVALSILLCAAHRFEESEKALGTALAVDPQNPWALHNHAVNLMYQQRAEEAEQFLVSADELLPGNFMINYHLSHVLQLQQRYEEAVSLYKRCLLFEPNWKEAESELEQLQSFLKFRKKAVRSSNNVRLYRYWPGKLSPIQIALQLRLIYRKIRRFVHCK